MPLETANCVTCNIPIFAGQSQCPSCVDAPRKAREERERVKLRAGQRAYEHEQEQLKAQRKAGKEAERSAAKTAAKRNPANDDLTSFKGRLGVALYTVLIVFSSTLMINFEDSINSIAANFSLSTNDLMLYSAGGLAAAGFLFPKKMMIFSVVCTLALTAWLIFIFYPR